MTDTTITADRGLFHLSGQSVSMFITPLTAAVVQWTTGRLRVPEFLSSDVTHRQLLARTLNQAAQGLLDCTLIVTLLDNAAVSTIMDARINVRSSLIFAPQTAKAGAEMAAGMWWVCENGKVTVNHTNTADTDKTFIMGIVG